MPGIDPTALAEQPKTKFSMCLLRRLLVYVQLLKEEQYVVIQVNVHVTVQLIHVPSSFIEIVHPHRQNIFLFFQNIY